tara:strand:- start:14565 stop:15476 length:912 start_codon:yes stop_codon:yes gene_type:complete
MSLNKVITSVNALVNNVSIPVSEVDNVVCIDVENNRIGVQTANPEREIDISGMLKTNYIYINNENNSGSEYDISYDKSYITFSRGLEIVEDLSMGSGKILCDSIDVSGIISDISFHKSVDISGFLFVDNSINVAGSVKVEGAVRANGNVLSSDDRLKHNERKINNGLEVIRKLEPQVYDKTSIFKSANYRGIINEPYIIEAGLIAQEVNTINDLSFTVIEGNSINPYYVNYNNIFVYGLAGIKELDNIVSGLTDRVNRITEAQDVSDINLLNIKNYVINQNSIISTLNSKITNLENRINNLEN